MRSASVTGRALRVMLAASSAALLATSMAGAGIGIGPVSVIVVVAAAAGAAMFPDSPAPVVASMLAVVIFIAGDPGFGPWLVLAASLLHTTHVLASIAEVVPDRSVVEHRALAPTVRRWARTQLLTVSLLIIVAAVIRS